MADRPQGAAYDMTKAERIVKILCITLIILLFIRLVLMTADVLL